MTLTSKDILKIQELYGSLERLQKQRAALKDVKLELVSGLVRRGTSGVEKHEFVLDAEAGQEFKDLLARDIRKRAAKIVEQLHKLGCEAKLTED